MAERPNIFTQTTKKTIRTIYYLLIITVACERKQQVGNDGRLFVAAGSARAQWSHKPHVVMSAAIICKCMRQAALASLLSPPLTHINKNDIFDAFSGGCFLETSTATSAARASPASARVFLTLRLRGDGAADKLFKSSNPDPSDWRWHQTAGRKLRRRGRLDEKDPARRRCKAVR